MEGIIELQRDRKTIEKLVPIWESAVVETHTFLSREDIDQLKPFVQQALHEIPALYGFITACGGLQGFMGVENQKIEMLFIDVHSRGLGIGKQFVHYATTKLQVKYVDVNEQNTQAVGFYKHMGFECIKRSDLDGQGKPFPILHMKLKE